jgi:hypothetical protein
MAVESVLQQVPTALDQAFGADSSSAPYSFLHFFTTKLKLIIIYHTTLSTAFQHSAQCFSTLGHTATACHGVSVLIQSGFSGEVVGPTHSNWVFVRLSGQEILTPTIIGSIYLPHGAASRPTQTQLAADLVRLTNGYPDTPLVIMGDFNLDLEQLQRLSRDWPGIFQISWNDGVLPTVRRTGGSVAARRFWKLYPAPVCSGTGISVTTTQWSTASQPCGAVPNRSRPTLPSAPC